MALTRVGVATGTTTCTVPTHSVGDLIVIFAYRTGSTTAPSLGAGYTSILTKSGTTCSARIGYRIANATNDASGTWTNSSALVCHVYTSSLYSSGSSMAIGGSASSSSTTVTVNYPALTMTNGGGTSWAAGFGGVSNLTQTIATAPAGMTNESLETAAASQAAGHDTNGTVSSWSSTNATDTGTAGNSVSCTLEICENAAGAAISNIVQEVATQPNVISANNEPLENLVTYSPGHGSSSPGTLAGNGLLYVVAYPSGATPVITDDQSNTWPASGATGTVTADAGAGNMALQAFVLKTATTGTQKVTCGFGGSPQTPVRSWLFELYNVTGTIEGSATGTAKNTAGVVAPGAFTPSVANCLVFSFMSDSNTSGTTNPSRINAANGYFLNDADVSWNGGTGTPSASQAVLQTTAVSTNALFNLAIGGTETYNVLALALSTGSQGTAKPAGIHVDRVLYFSTNSNPANYTFQIPSTGNLGVICTPEDLSGTAAATARDSDSVSWTQNGTAGTPQFFFRSNLTPNPGRTVTVAYGAHTAQNLDYRYLDISGADPSPFAGTASGNSTAVDNTNAVSDQPDLTPTAGPGLTIALLQVGIGPTLGITSPAGAVPMWPTYQIAKFVGGITTTTLTVASTTWGAINNGGISAINNPPAVLGTTIQSGAGPYTIQPSQTVTAGSTMTQTSTDSSEVNWGNGFGILYYSTLAAQAWNWNFANAPSNSVTSTAVAFLAAPTGPAPQGVEATRAGPPTIRLGTPVSRLRGGYEAPPVAQALGLAQGDESIPWAPGIRTGTPRQKLRASQSYIIVSSQSVTVALTGSSITSSSGTLGVQHTNPFTGSVITSSTGSLAVKHTNSMSGISITSASGLLSPQNAHALTGASITSTAGIFANKDFEALTGQRATFNAGTMTPSTSSTVALLGSSITSKAGSLSPQTAHVFLGSNASFGAGTLKVSMTIGMTGQRAHFTAGTMTIPGGGPVIVHAIRYFVNLGTLLIKG